ncbi:flagellar hook-associated protein FlgK [Pseudoalteromonas sp. S16_S37]|uniref:flagellar hook-associated protein FlgK n=1 Tax=Pseudoalteromonas sp. S16_S37 TaxID=2720228 RepID=UPI0016807A77|nr:flagellar hook-associated protein FlgK [Pseudoalteromonas sp. S16_S37]MBD1582199.1 flagellar hook-associated protein FlgK [Pseudoalteromonas sp. S16_S37]
MSFDLMQIGTSGVRASSELLQTTSRNISNLNTKGYIRERTEHATTVGNMVGRPETVRLINDFAAKQLNRDISNKAYYDQFVTESSRIDTLFAEESNSLSTSINTMFNSLQEAMNQPASTVSRSLFMNSAQGLVEQMHRLSNIVFDQKSVVNEQLSLYTDEANSLIEKISQLNNKVASTYTSDDHTVALSVLNERDQAIRDLSALVDIETLDGSNGEKLVFLGSGQALVMENGTFNAFALDGDPDPNVKDLKLDVRSGKAIALDVDLGSLKGKIGGLMAFRDDILQPAQNQLGQIGIAIADAFNQQNALGMNLDGNLGGNIFSIPTVQGYAFQNNTGTGVVNATLETGLGRSLPATDFQVTFLTATTVEISAIDSEGNVIGTPSTANVTAGAINSGTITSGESFGLDMTVTGAAAAGDSFVVKLNSIAAGSLELATQRPEHLALASPIRTEVSANNISTASISAGVVSNTSNINAGPPIALAQGDITITKTAVANQYQIVDGSGTNLVTITPPANSFLNAAGAPYNAYGFDFNIEGQPATGDVFTIKVNSNGFDDNRNGLALSQLKDDELVRQGVVASADNFKTFNESYAGLVTEVGVIANQAKTNGAAFDALATQSETWFESISGVNLDEEAANLLRFQQSYSASAQIISAARTIFDTLLSAAR